MLSDKKSENSFILRSIISPESLYDVISKKYSRFNIKNIKLLSIGDNDNYLVECHDNLYVFRIYRFKKHWLPTKSRHLFEIDFLNFLHRSNISVSYPIQTNNGEYLSGIEAPEGPRFCSLFSYATGKPMTFNPQNCFNYGKIISEVHIASATFCSSETPLLIDENFLLDLPLARISDFLGKTRRKDISFLEVYAEKLKSLILIYRKDYHENDWGIIGGDFHGGNHFCDKKGDITLFDFDLCGYGWRMYDLAVFKWALFNICRRAPMVKNRKLLWESFLKGYETRKKLIDGQIKIIPVFVQARQIWLMGSETTYKDKILDRNYWDKMFYGLRLGMEMYEHEN